MANNNNLNINYTQSKTNVGTIPQSFPLYNFTQQPFGSTPQQPFGSTPQQPFGSIGSTPQQPFGSNAIVSQQPFGSNAIVSQQPFGSIVSTPQQPFGSNAIVPFGTPQQPQPTPQQPFGSNAIVSKQTLGSNTACMVSNQPFGSLNIQTFNVPSLVPLNLPKNKIKGLICMVCLDQKNTLLNTKNLFDRVFDTTLKFSIKNLWFTALVKYSDDNFLTQKINGDYMFTLLYSSLLRELMAENIKTPQQLYEWLLSYSKTLKNKKMLWLFTILKYAEKNKFVDILDMEDCLEVLVLALQTFIEHDNNPTIVVENALHSSNDLFKTFLLSLVGASYGTVEKYQPFLTTQLTDLITLFK
jgi:hypothetical protein